MTRDNVLRLAREAGFDPGTPAIEDWLERFYALAVADERARMPPPPLVVDVSSIDPGELADAMKRARPDSAPVLVPVQATRKQHIDALVGDRLTADKADHICERDGYAVTGVVLTLPDGRACIVNRSAVRWLHGETDLWNLLHTDSALNQRLIAEAVDAEREAFAKVCDVIRRHLKPDAQQQNACEALESASEAIRSRGQS